MRPYLIAIASLLGLGLGLGDSAARCLAYAPVKVVLVGTLTKRVLPGPPNYVSVARGDHPENVFILKLDEPICVSADPSSRLNGKSHAHVTEVQLVASDLDLMRLVNRHVRATGKFFGAQTGHHRTPVVLNVAKLSGL